MLDHILNKKQQGTMISTVIQLEIWLSSLLRLLFQNKTINLREEVKFKRRLLILDLTNSKNNSKPKEKP